MANAPVVAFTRPLVNIASGMQPGIYLWPPMMFTRSVRALLALVTASFLHGCSTDLDVTAPYQEITVVYALLNKNDNIHWVKINKAFLGEGNAFAYAQIPDSTEYTEEQLPPAQRRIEKVDGAGNVLATLELHDTLVDRPTGIFHAPEHKLYYFRGDQANGTLDAGGRYQVSLTVKGKNITASTPIVNDLSIYNPTQNLNTDISFRAGAGYVPYTAFWFTTANARRYESYYRVFYDEILDDGSVHPKNFSSQIGTVITSTAPGDQISASLNGELFYQTVASRVPNIEPVFNEALVTKRIFRGIELYWWVAGPDLHTYLQLANPISGLVEERPDYSNVQGGYGIMSSRMYKQVGDANGRKDLNAQSKQELISGSITGGLKFCIPGEPGCD
jgi:hypothetical protein